MVRRLTFFAVIFVAAFLFANKNAYAIDPLDPFDINIESEEPITEEDKTSDELIAESIKLLTDQRPLDARTLLLKALKKDPISVKAHLLLGSYYLDYVGHFRLAKRYIERAFALFKEQNGSPPYLDLQADYLHQQLYNLYSQAKLNLDDYEGALKVLDEYVALGYMANWYPASRAWILFKMGKIEEAIQVAKAAIITGADPRRTLNMLGILLSANGQQKESISIFQHAIQLEEGFGREAQTATPLNNMGEVFEEMFKDKEAERAYLRATGLPDGCEHVLPALNLSMLYMEQLNWTAASKALDNFESCVAQFPLRNGEEHRAFVHLARGRIDLHTGHIDDAINHLSAALEKRQWYGKIGTDLKDLVVGAQISLAYALKAKNNIESTQRRSILSSIISIYDSAKRSIWSNWILSEAKRMLIEDLNHFEDLHIRHTDAMIEYPTLGFFTRTFPSSVLNKIVQREISEKDNRPEAKVYYDLYLAEKAAENGDMDQLPALTDTIFNKARPIYDDLLIAKTYATRAEGLDFSDPQYQVIAFNLYRKLPAMLRNHGLKLPVRLTPDESWTESLISSTPFTLCKRNSCPFTLSFAHSDKGLEVQFISSDSTVPNARSEGLDEDLVMNTLSNSVFQESFK